MKKFEKIIDSIKRQLIPNDPTTYNQASFLLLKSIRENDEEVFLTSLIDSGIISNIIRIINPINRGFVLNSIEIVSKSDVLYKNSLVDETITNITKGDYTDSQEEATVALIVLHRIVTKVFEFEESLGLSLMHRHAEGLLSFVSQPTFDPSSLICATKLLNFIIKYSANDFKQTNFQLMEHMYKVAMEYLISVEVCFDLDSIRTICCISTSIVKLCYEIDVSCSDMLSANNLILFDFIKFLAFSKVIPHLQKLDIDIESAEYFVEFLETVINLRGYKNQEICDRLLKNGYLKYLLQLSVLAPERLFFRMQICRVISKIIMGLKEYLELPINDWLGGSAAFQSFLSTGLGSLPIDFQQWEDLLKTHDPESKSLLILLYCHFIATHEKYIFTQKSLALNLRNVKGTTEPIFLKVIFLLYSVSALSSEISNLPSNLRLYSKAIQKFAATVQKQGRIELFYTHHEDLLIYSIREIGIPEGLRIKVIRLWLDKSNTDEEFDVLVKECLNQGYDELKIVKLLMSFLHENCMENLNNVTRTYGALLRYRNEIPEDIIEFILKTLAEDLASYTPSNSHILKIVLRFACTLPISKSVCPCILKNCAKNIGKIVIREDTDLILKTLLITQASFTIRHSLASNYFTVADIFLKNNEFMNEVYETGIVSKGVIMKYSIRTLMCLIFCQKKFNLQCKSVSQMTFKDLKNLLIRMFESNCTPTLGVEFIKLLLINRVNNPLIDLYKSTNPKYLRYIFDVYFLIHNIHDETIPGKEEQIYECLSAILDYSYDQKFNINVLLTCAATPDLMQIAINRILKSNLLSLSFLDFATKWLTYRHAFRKQTRMKIKSLAEKSADILIDFRPFAEKMKDGNHEIVQDFLTTIDIYLANYQQ